MKFLLQAQFCPHCGQCVWLSRGPSYGTTATAIFDFLTVHREKDGGTEVALRVAYLLPEQLREFVGPVGVWGDVNDILQENLDAMKVRAM